MYEYFPIKQFNTYSGKRMPFYIIGVSHGNILKWERDSRLKIPPFCVLRLAERKSHCKETGLNKTAAIKYQYLKLTVSQGKQGYVIDWKKIDNKVLKDEMWKDKKAEQVKTFSAGPCLVNLLSPWLHRSSTCSRRSRTASRIGSKEASRLTATAGRSPVPRELFMDSHVWGGMSHINNIKLQTAFLLCSLGHGSL